MTAVVIPEDVPLRLTARDVQALFGPPRTSERPLRRLKPPPVDSAALRRQPPPPDSTATKRPPPPPPPRDSVATKRPPRDGSR